MPKRQSDFGSGNNADKTRLPPTTDHASPLTIATQASQRCLKWLARSQSLDWPAMGHFRTSPKSDLSPLDVPKADLIRGKVMVQTGRIICVAQYKFCDPSAVRGSV